MVHPSARSRGPRQVPARRPPYGRCPSPSDAGVPMTLNPFTFFRCPLARRGRKAVAVSQAPARPSGPSAVAHPMGRGGGGGDDRVSELLDAVARLAEQQRFLLDALRPAAPAGPATPAV